MGTLTKKLHILAGGTEETCDIYTTPEEVGGSPYLALEVDGTKGYVKLGSTTDANATHLRVEKNGTTYAAWKKATVNVPTGGIAVVGEDSFTVPSGIHVIEICSDLDPVYVGVTPNTTHSVFIQVNLSRHVRYHITIGCTSHNKIYTTGYIPFKKKLDDTMFINWSPEINKKTPTVTDY